MNESIPKTMRAIEIAQPGPPTALVPTTRSLPLLGEYEVLIRVSAAGVNRPDVLQRKGLYPPPLGASDIPGLEVAGNIVALGPKADKWKIGASVCALLSGGGYAEYASVHQSLCLPVPKGLSLTEAASLPEAAFTVWSNVFERAAIKPGEIFLVHGGSSGIGVMAIQMARALGHRVFATAGSEEKCAVCEKLGAEKAINYKNEDFVEVVKENTSGRGVDVILDMVAGDYIARDLKTLADDGRIVIIAFLGGSKASIDSGEILRRRLTITGSTLRARSNEFKAHIARALAEKIWPLIETGAIKTVVHATFPINDAAQAHSLMESSQHIGKLVLTLP
jgi:NADPH:quinone reductase